jgi:hypothetical protein
MSGEPEERQVRAWVRGGRVGGFHGVTMIRLVERGRARPADTIVVDANVDVDAEGNIMGVEFVWLNELPVSARGSG